MVESEFLQHQQLIDESAAAVEASRLAGLRQDEGVARQGGIGSNQGSDVPPAGELLPEEITAQQARQAFQLKQKAAVAARKKVKASLALAHDQALLDSAALAREQEAAGRVSHSGVSPLF